jgi:two-component sensor histidine kinase
MQLVYGMLSKLLDEATDVAGKRGIRSVARRVSTLALVYDHLLGNEMTRTTDFGSYVRSLCENIAEIQATDITLKCDCDRLVLDLDNVTVLGIVVAELVTNSYDHAFPDGKGSINVSVRSPLVDGGMATLKISDNGTGFIVEAGSKRHGLGLVQRLIQQARGTSTVDLDHGTAWNIEFPVVRHVVAGTA